MSLGEPVASPVLWELAGVLEWLGSLLQAESANTNANAKNIDNIFFNGFIHPFPVISVRQ